MTNNEDRMIELLEELVKWTKVSSFRQIKDLLLALLSTPEEKTAYQSSDGKRTTREVAKLVNVSTATISTWWKNWIKAGIADPIKVQRGERARHVFSLDDFGIEV